jgi:hypothetical protein
MAESEGIGVVGGDVPDAASIAASRCRRIDGLSAFFLERGRLCSGDWMRDVDSIECMEELEELEDGFRFKELDAEVESELDVEPRSV